MGPESVVLHAGSIVFNGAFVTLMPAFTLGARYVLARQFDAESVIEQIDAEQVTHIMMVPSQIVAMLNAPNFDPARLRSLQMVLSLGAPLSVAHKDQLEQALPGIFYELYGLTEGFVTILDREDALAKRGSVGVPPPFFEMKILRDDGSEAATGRSAKSSDADRFSCPATTGGPISVPTHCVRAGCIPVTSVTSMRTAISTSPTARRTHDQLCGSQGLSA